MMRSGNPVLRQGSFQGDLTSADRMTINGTIGRTAILLILLTVTAGWTWMRFYGAVETGGAEAGMAAVQPFLWGGLIGGLVLAIATVVKPAWSPITAPMYALAEGFALGGLSAVFELRYPDIVIQAVALTLAVLAVMLGVYRSGLIKVNDKFRMGVVAATGGVMLVYVVDIVMGFFGHHIPMINDGGAIGIGFSLLVVGIAALNLVLDFDIIERGANQGAPSYMEWYGAFALVVTLVWLYLEMLRLLSKLRR